MLKDDISVVIIASNADKTIKECLDNLKSFQEVILYLNNSIDKTREIAKKYLNVKIIDGEFIGFGNTRNRATSYASNNWILSLDSDEILDDKIINEIKSQDYSNKHIIYVLKLDNHFLGKKTISRDFKERLFNKNHTKFNDNEVHEKLIIKESSIKVSLKESIKHLNITDINQTLTKMIKYTDLGAKDKKICFFSIVILKAFFAFFQTYFLKGYIIDGWRGFTIAITYSNRRFYKYLKQFLNCQK
jgi:glycosyltransferase involved in cell wall biosynthesis